MTFVIFTNAPNYFGLTPNINTN